MNRREASDWVHVQSIRDEMPFDDLVAAFTALTGRVPGSADRRHGLFRSCMDIVIPSMGVSHDPKRRSH